MPAFAALTINDGQASPAAHTFTPITTNGSLARFADKTGGIAVGYINLAYEVREAKSPTGANSVLMSVELPTTAVVDGVTKRVRVSSAQVRLNFAQDSTEAERKDLLAYIANGLGNATVKPAAYSFEAFW